MLCVVSIPLRYQGHLICIKFVPTVIASKHNSEWCRTCVYIGTVVESIEVFYLVIQVLTLVPFLHIIGKMEGDSTTLNCSTAHIAHVIHFAECT